MTSLDAPNAALVRESERGVLVVRGPDRAKWLNGVVTPEVGNLAVGRGVFGLLLSKVGKIQADFLLAAEPERLCLAFSPGTVEQARSELERMLVMEDAEIDDASAELECVSLHGPEALDVARRVEGPNARAAELDRTGQGGAVVFLTRSAAGEVLGAARAAGATELDAPAWLALRLARGIASFGIDYGPADNPHEAGLERIAISWAKGCYLGQEAVFMQDARGKLKRRLSLLETSDPAPAPGEKVFTDAGEEVGEVTSSAPGSEGRGGRLLARVKAPHFEPGTRLRAGAAAAIVLSRPV